MRSALLFAPVLLMPTSLLAQTSTPIDRGRIDRDQPTSERSQVPEKAPDLPTTTARIDTADSVTPIAAIQFVGTDVPAIVAHAAERFVGRPASRATLQGLTAAMSDAYGRSPVALFTIVVPDQDLSTGTLRVLVAEGHVEAVILTGEVEGRPLRLVRAYADRLTREKPTARRTLERYLSLIRDIPGLKVDATLQAGESKGGVRLLLKLDYAKPTLSFGFDNRTTRLVRDGQVQATGRIHGALREGDTTELALAAAVNLHDYRYVGLSHSTPIGTDGMRAGVSAGYLATRSRGTDIRGKAKTLGMTLSYPLIRSNLRNLTLSAAIDGVNSDNAAFGSLIASERTRAARLAAGYGAVKGRLSASASAALSQGLNIAGARVDAPLAKGKFLKVNGRFGIDRTLGKALTIRLRGSGQWTRDALPVVERFSVGGPDFGRAFENALVNADRGVAGLAELGWRPVRQGKWGQSELYGFTDMADVHFRDRGILPATSLDLGSAGAGVRFAWNDRARLELEAARPIDNPYAGYDGGWRLSVGWRLSLRP